jgi:hypothetical protein
VSLPAVLARVAELNLLVAPAPPVVSAPGRNTASFQGMLQGAGLAAGGAAASAALALPPGAGGRGALLAAVQAEVGQAEAPPGSNDSPRIAEYRQATAGAPGPGPWCAYFVSWAAKQAGMPLGDGGEGFGAVDSVQAWAERTGRFVPTGTGAPRPGDLIVWDQHIGVVESVAGDGTIHTVEGNSSNQVSRRTHGATSALGFVRMGP